MEMEHEEFKHYCYSIITHIASLLSDNDDIVKDFVIYRKIPEITSFNDVILKIWFQNDLNPHLYLFNVINFDVKKHDLMKYGEIVNVIMERKCKYDYLNDVTNENIHFCIYSSYFVDDDILLDYDADHKLFIFEKLTCFKLKPENQLKKFPNLFWLYLNQPKSEYINSIWSNSKNFSEEIINNVLEFIKENFEMNDKLTRNNFDTEILKMHLNDIIVKPLIAFEINIEQAQIWNRIVLSQDVTVVEDKHGIENAVFGCINQQINYICNNNFEWNKVIKNTTDFDTTSYIYNFFNALFKNNLQYPPNKLNTIEDLLLQMWELNYVPLVLKLKNKNFISILKRYKHLQKKFVIIGDVQIMYDEVHSFSSSIFTNINDIQNLELRIELLSSIFVSFQGRAPVQLIDIIGNDQNCLKELSCSEILNLIKKRKLNVNELCLKEMEDVIFIISDDHVPTTYDTKKIEVNNCSNIIIECNPIYISKYIQWIKESPFQSNPIFCLKRKDAELFEISSLNLKKLRQYLVDDENNGIYITENDEILPVIGKRFNQYHEDYIERSFRKPLLDKEIFFCENRRVFFLCGDIDSYEPFIRSEMVYLDEYQIDGKISMNRNAYFEIKDDESIEDYWTKYSKRDCQLFHMNVKEGNVELLKANNCKSLTSHILYTKEEFPEKDFFDEITNGITLICGEPGVGKSWLLQSLSQIYDEKNFILFCDLVDFYNDFVNKNVSLQNPLEFIFDKYENSPYKRILFSVYEHHRINNRLILFLDSLDEMLAICKEEAFKFLEKLIESKVRIVTASRFNTDDLLINSFNFQPIRIVNFTTNDGERYLRQKIISNVNVQDIPAKFKEIPLYLKFLSSLDNECVSKFKIMDKWNLYERIIEKEINSYCNYNQFDKEDEKKQEFIENHEIMALVVVFSKDMVLNLDDIKDINELFNKFENLDYKSHLVKEFSGDFPIFKHYTFAEHLAIKWVIENLSSGRSQYFYKHIMHKNDINTRFLFDSMICRELNLHKAVLQEDLELVKNLLSSRDINLEEMDKCGRTALLLASTYCTKEVNLKILEELFKKSCNVYNHDLYMDWNWMEYIKTFYTGDFFHDACKYGLIKALELYLNYFKIDIGNDHVYTGFNSDNLDIVLMLITNKPALLLQFYDQLIRTAINSGRLDIAYEVIRLNCNNSPLQIKFVLFNEICENELKEILNDQIINLKFKSNFTALHLACFRGNAKLVNKLIKFGADLQMRDDYGNLPLHYAVIKNSTEIVNILLHHMPIVTVNNQYKSIPLHFASRFANLEVVEALINKGVDINEKNEANYTALMLASENGKADIVEILLDHGADVNIKDYCKNTALHLACSSKTKNFKIIELLVKKSEDLLYLINNNGYTPLKSACTYGNYDIVKYILSIRPNYFKYVLADYLNHCNSRQLKNACRMKLFSKEHLEYPFRYGLTPLHIAARHGYSAALQCLIEEGVKIDPKDENGFIPLHFVTSERNIRLFQRGYDREKLQSNRNIVDNSGRNIVKITLARTTTNLIDLISDVNVIKSLLRYCSVSETSTVQPECSHHIEICNSNLSLLETIFTNKSDIAFNLIKEEKVQYTTIKHLKSESMKITSFNNESKRLDLFCIEGTIEKIEYFLEHNFKDSKFLISTSNIIKLIQTRQLIPLKMLIENNFINKYDLEFPDYREQRPLHYAVKDGGSDIVCFLINVGVRVDSEDDTGETPLHQVKYESDVNMLLQEYKRKKLDLNMKNRAGYTALHIACRKRMERIVRALLLAGASASCEDNYGRIPSYYAAGPKYKIISKMFENIRNFEDSD